LNVGVILECYYEYFKLLLTWGLIPSQWGWDIIDLSMGLIIRYVGLKLNYGAYVGQLTWDFILREEGYEFLFL